MPEFVIRLIDDGSLPQQAPKGPDGNAGGSQGRGSTDHGGSPISSRVTPPPEGSQHAKAINDLAGGAADRAGLGQAKNAFDQVMAFGDKLSQVTGPPANASTTAIQAELVGGAAASGGSATTATGGAAAAGGSTAAGGAVAAMATNPYTIAAAAVAATVVGGAAIAKEYDKIMSREAARIKDYSPELSNVAALSEIRTEIGKMRRADRIGGDLADYENFKSRAEQRLAEVQTEILHALLDIFKLLEPTLEQALHGADIGIANLQVLAAHGEAVNKTLRGDIVGALAANDRANELLGKVGKEILEWVRNEDSDDMGEDDIWLRAFLTQQPIELDDAGNPIIPPKAEGAP